MKGEENETMEIGKLANTLNSGTMYVIYFNIENEDIDDIKWQNLNYQEFEL